MLGHLGVNVPDLSLATRYYDGLLPMLGYEVFFRTADESAYRPAGGKPGTFLFLYPATDPSPFSGGRTGLQHLAFMVKRRSEVDEVNRYVVARGGTVIQPPQEFPQYPRGGVPPRPRLTRERDHHRVPAEGCSRVRVARVTLTLVIVVGWLVLCASAVLWAWVSRRAINANPASTIPRFRHPAVRPTHDRILQSFAVATEVQGMFLLWSPAKPRNDASAWMAVVAVAVIGALFVVMPIEIHNRRVARSHEGWTGPGRSPA